MPLRDHFHSPLDDAASSEEFRGQWPAMIVLDLARRLPEGYVAAPRVHLGAFVEIDVATFEEDAADAPLNSTRCGCTTCGAGGGHRNRQPG